MSIPTAAANPTERGIPHRPAVATTAVQAGQAVVALAAMSAIVAWVVVALLRWRYPYELEHTESGLVEHVRRLTMGQSIYVAPSVDFVPFPYAPGYVAVSSAVSAVLGVNFASLRLVSILAACATFGILWRIVRRQTGSRWAAFVAVGMFAASYRLAGAWFDVAKPDMLFLALTLAALDVLVRVKNGRAAIGAGALMAAAILTKQTAVFVALPVAVFVLVTQRKVGLRFSVTVLALAGGVSLVLDVLSDGWYRYYVWQQLTQHETLDLTPWHFLVADLAAYWPTAALAALAGRRWLAQDRRWEVGLYAAAAAGMIAGSFAARRHIGGYDNVLLPACAALAILGGLAVGEILRSRRPVLALPALVLCMGQFFLLRYDPAAQVPSAADAAAGESLVAWLADVPGDVLVVSHPTYAVMAGHPSHAQYAGAWDVERGTAEEPRRLMLASYADAIHQQRFTALVLDGVGESSLFPPDWQTFYVRSDVNFAPPPGVFVARASGSGRPTEVWLRRSGALQ